MPVLKHFVFLGLTPYIHETFGDFNGCYQFLRLTAEIFGDGNATIMPFKLEFKKTLTFLGALLIFKISLA